MEESEYLTQEELEEIDEHLTFLSRRFSKMKFKRNPTLAIPPTTFRKDGQSGKGLVDISKFKCFNCGITNHFSNDVQKNPKSEKKRTNDCINYKKKNTMIFSDRRKRHLCLKKKTGDAGTMMGPIRGRIHQPCLHG